MLLKDVWRNRLYLRACVHHCVEDRHVLRTGECNPRLSSALSLCRRESSHSSSSFPVSSLSDKVQKFIKRLISKPSQDSGSKFVLQVWKQVGTGKKLE
ncbi:BMP/retinoic acid-inducible neural-specific protein 2 [Manis javanica]|nr:BMP/retinoic acid-inducible neural-specific protein 2 [Manis javanica]